jgi:GDP-mannose 6-dehydrogenase
MKIAVFGTGYVGCTSLVCLAELGHEVLGIDVSESKVRLINEGLSPILEPGVDELIAKHLRGGRLRASLDIGEAARWADLALVCVGTPSTPHGAIDTSFVERVTVDLAKLRLRENRVIPILMRSTGLPSVHRELIGHVRDAVGASQAAAYCVHPEFLRAGSGIRDFMEPPKIVFGCTDEVVAQLCRGLYPGIQAPTFFTDPMTAALVKYADNCFHAVKVTFANEIGMLAKAQEVDARKVMDLFVADTKLNISPSYLRPGFAFGGSCLPKDLRGVVAWSRQHMLSLPMLEEVLSSNDLQVERVAGHILDNGFRSVGLFGLAFKDHTDDLRESPMVTLAETLLGKGLALRVYDPALSLKRLVGKNLVYALSALPHLEQMLVHDPSDAVSGSHAVVIARAFADVRWSELPWRSDQVVIDLVGKPDLDGIPAQVQGLYW